MTCIKPCTISIFWKYSQNGNATSGFLVDVTAIIGVILFMIEQTFACGRVNHRSYSHKTLLAITAYPVHDSDIIRQ